MVCAFTGHRPEKLPWGSDETDPRCLALKEQIADRVERAFSLGYREFCCGMARGCDQYFAEAVLALALREPEVALDAWLPCPEQADRWLPADRRRYEDALRRCRHVFLTEPQYTEGCMLRRNRAMLRQAGLLISVYDGSGGGTGAALRYAAAIGVPVLPVWR